IAKAAMTTATVAAAGRLNDQQFAEFIRLVQEEPTLLGDVRIQPMASHTAKLESLEFGGRITFKPTEGVAASPEQRGSLNASKVELHAVEIQCEVSLTHSLREENLMRDNLDDYVRDRMVQRFALDLQDLMVLGDLQSTDPFLATLDGLLEQAVTHVIDHTSSPIAVTDDAFYDGFVRLPARFRRDKRNLRIYCNSDVIAAFNKYLAGRETSIGDIRMVDGTEKTFWNGIELYEVTSVPPSKYLLTNRKNIVLGVFREVYPYTEEQPSARQTLYGLTMRVDVKYAEETAVVKCQGLNPSGS
ncbi:MAG: phage major capsid protein, partial [Pseudomonadota bacterium]